MGDSDFFDLINLPSGEDNRWQNTEQSSDIYQDPPHNQQLFDLPTKLDNLFS